MSMTPIKKAVAVVGQYTDKSGKDKKQYHTCGKVFQRDDGSMCMKLDAVPVGFDGWLNFYDLDENRDRQNQQGMAQAKQSAAVPLDDFEDKSLPF
jgi:hypothetical protein